MSSYDAWLAHNPADDDVIEISYGEWSRDEDLQEQYPMEDTRCAICTRPIGGFLGYDEETSADRNEFQSIWVLPDERAVCEDCANPEPDYPDHDEEDYER